ncbi:hypothetical protein DFJ58DRAFT_662430, partial [Suillus subalutaceus]|uniref:uncharacterized protein n=1 Tax=Suillus subalutaceus TaxID=48586 RepID=UPI001B8809CC
WVRFWSQSPRHDRTVSINPNILKGSFISLAQHLPKRYISLLIWLCTRHISLNQHLFRISRSPMPNCSHCATTAETVLHFLITCPHYARTHHILMSALCHCASSISYLLSSPKASAPLHMDINWIFF